MRANVHLVIVAGPLVAFAGCGIAPTEPGWSPPKETAASELARRVDFAPTRTPDRIMLTWAADPSTTQTVTWRTDATAEEPVVEYAVATKGPEFAKNPRDVMATSQSLATDLGEALYHTATIRDLEPGTKYAYRVGDDEVWSEWSHFTTATAEPAPFSFVYFGDAQNDVKSHWSRVVREAFKEAPRASFLLHAGDLINRANADHEWGEWFYSGGWIFRTIPSIATPGNHEYSRGKLSRNWRPTFEFPLNGPAGHDEWAETVYYIDYQGARIISLDTEPDDEELEPQARWLDEVLSQPDRPRWTIITTHYPMYSAAKRRDNPDLRKYLQPVIDKHAVDIVLQGHDHTYGRTTRVRHSHAGEAEHEHVEPENVPVGVRARSDETGTVYVVSVSGPKMYTVDKKPVMERTAQNTQLYQVITIDGDTLRFSAYTAVGDLFDRFTLHKEDGRPNRMVEGAIHQ